jgi:type IV pilus assembly protein PilB
MPHAVAQSQRIGSILVDARAITQAQLDTALAEQKEMGGRIGEVLVASGVIEEKEIAEALERQLHIIREVPVRGDIDAAIAGRVDSEWIHTRHCVPLRKEDDRVIVAMADPLDFDTVNELESKFGCPVEPRIATPSEIARVQDQAQQ